ncbi:MAG: hypothetical protein K0B16_07060 [Burkholderiaceae bacterium]|nr:hypothetical protein [Burkholderiaceae bacterium]
MTRRASYPFAAVLVSTLLAACGGSGPQVSPYSFDLHEAWVDQATGTAAYSFTMSGKIDLGDCIITVSSEPGSGIFNVGALWPSTFETINGFQKLSVADISMILSGCGETGIVAPFNYRYTDYFDSNYWYLGRINQSDPDFLPDCPYNVASNQAPLPTAAKVGDTGQLFTLQTWDSPDKNYSCDQMTVSYAVAADTKDSVLFKIIYSEAGATETMTFRVTTSGETTLVSIRDSADGLALTMTFF